MSAIRNRLTLTSAIDCDSLLRMTETDGSQEPQDHLANYLQAELMVMRRAFVELIETNPYCPTWAWADVEEVLLGLTTTAAQELAIRGALSALVKESVFKPPTLVLSEIVRLVRAGHDQVFQRSVQDMLEAEMP